MVRRRLTTFACAIFLMVAGALSVPAADSAQAAPPNKRTDCGGERPAKPEGGRYVCSFEDDFSGGRLDSSKWVVQQTALTGMTTGGRDCYVADADNVWVAGDTLYMGAYSGGFRAFDISGELRGDLRAQKREIAHLPTADLDGVVRNSVMTGGVVVKDGLAYVNDMHNGLWIVRIDPKSELVP